MLSPELLKQIKKIQLKAGHLANSSMVGEYSSAFKGLGMEFDEVREYVPGDDVRQIDWNVTARMRVPYIKTFKEEREMTLILLVDVSPSQRFGTEEKFKKEQAAELAAVLAFLAIKNNDKVGLIAFSDHIEKYIPPKKGRSHVWNIIREIISHKSTGKSTDINGALDYLMKIRKQKAMCFLISDFIAKDFEKNMRVVGKRHEFICAKVSDKREHHLPDCGFVQFFDKESGAVKIIDTSNKKVRDAYEQEFFKREEHLQTLFRKAGIDYFNIYTHESIVNPLMTYMKKRERKH